ncbi:hypothetical protein GCM10027168_70890 [Streptomyces capparidis]
MPPPRLQRAVSASPNPGPRFGDRDRVEDTDLATVEGTRQHLAVLTADTNRRIRQHHAAHNPPTAPIPPAAPGRSEQPPTYPAPPTPPTGKTV